MSYGNIILPASQNKGIIKPDAEGYYRIKGGVFNKPNRLGITYRANRYILECLEMVDVSGGSDMRRRLDRGEVYMEMDHPVQWFYEKIDGQIVRTRITDVFTWIARLKKIEMDRVCAFIKKVIPDDSKFDYRTMTGPIEFDIITKPHGVFGSYFESNLKDPNMGTSVSIRTVTAPQKFGDTVRTVEYWTGVDWVPEPGFEEATKYMTKVGGMEGFLNTFDLTEEDRGWTMDAKQSIEVAEAMLGNPNSIQTVGGMECYNDIKSMIETLKNSSAFTNQSNMKICHTKSPLDLF